MRHLTKHGSVYYTYTIKVKPLKPNHANYDLFDADLGGVLKKRIAPKGVSKRDANRSIIAFHIEDKIFFKQINSRAFKRDAQ